MELISIPKEQRRKPKHKTVSSDNFFHELMFNSNYNIVVVINLCDIK